MKSHEIQSLKREIDQHDREIARQQRIIQKAGLRIENEKALKAQAEAWLREAE